MKSIDSDKQPGEAFKNVLDGLEQLAGDLDAGQYPGRAWPAARVVVVSHRIAWKVAASIAGIAALIALAFQHLPATSPVFKMATGGSKTIARATVPAAKTSIGHDLMPRIVIVEDMDSYSIIDMTGDVPLVSFARRDSDAFDDGAPVLVEPVSEPATKNAPL